MLIVGMCSVRVIVVVILDGIIFSMIVNAFVCCSVFVFCSSWCVVLLLCFCMW